MEVFFISRGMNEQVEKWKKHMETLYLPLPIKDKDGKVVNIGYQCNLKPIQLWGYTFPREQQDLVLSSLNMADETSNIGWLHNLTHTTLLRKALKCEPIPKFNKVTPKYLGKEFVQLMPIGIKEDEYRYVGDITIPIPGGEPLNIKGASREFL